MSLDIRHGKRITLAASLVVTVVLVAGLLAGCQRFGGAPEQSAPAKPAAGQSAPASGGAQQAAPAAASGQQAAPAQKLVVKFSHVVAEDTPKHKAALKFKELAEKYSNGNIEVQVFPNSQLYKDAEEFAALQSNAVQYLAPGTAKFSVSVPEWQVFDLPYIFPTTDAVIKVADGPIGQELYKKLNSQKMQGVALWDNGFRYFTDNKHPMKDPADFKGLKFRADGKPAEALVKALGGTAQVMAFAEVFNALQQGVVDGQLNTFSNVYSMKFHEVQKYMTLSGSMSYLGYVVVTNADWYAKLPDGQRQILDKAMKEATAYEREIAAKENEEGLKKIKDSGKLDIYQLNDSELAAWKKAAQSVYPDYEKQIGKDLIDKVRNAK